ncbi:hypothetical protein Lal_00013414 [Lupinus albus]|nr:hypothetical protein Lal_00013414 [Lupinus albus]
MSTQVKPNIFYDENTSMFINTFQSPFFYLMLGNISSEFRRLITIGEIIMNFLGSGKIEKDIANMRSLLTPIPMKKVEPPYPQ